MDNLATNIRPTQAVRLINPSAYRSLWAFKHDKSFTVGVYIPVCERCTVCAKVVKLVFGVRISCRFEDVIDFLCFECR